MTHIAPPLLLDTDDETLEALIAIAERERTHALWSLEVQAATAELVHATWRVTVQAHSKRGARVPPPLAVPRPWRRDATTAGRARTVSVTEFARMMRARG